MRVSSHWLDGPWVEVSGIDLGEWVAPAGPPRCGAQPTRSDVQLATSDADRLISSTDGPR
jgi:hypothetical protein